MIREANQSDSWPALIYGETGRGKTCSMGFFYQRWTGYVKWHSVVNLLRSIMRCRKDGMVHDEKGNEVFEEQIFSRISEADLVCLDDAGLKALTDPQYEALYEILELRAGKPLIVTSNLSPDELAKVYDKRIFSRLCSGTVIWLQGVDHRLQGKKPIICD